MMFFSLIRVSLCFIHSAPASKKTRQYEKSECDNIRFMFAFQFDKLWP